MSRRDRMKKRKARNRSTREEKMEKEEREKPYQDIMMNVETSAIFIIDVDL